MTDKSLTLWSVTIRLWSREEEPGKWIAADTQRLAELHEGITGALMQMGWIVRVLDLETTQHLYRLLRETGEERQLPEDPVAQVKVYCEYLMGPDDPGWPWSLDTTGRNSGLYQYLVWGACAEDAARIIEQMPLGIVDLIQVTMDVIPYEPYKPTQQYLPLEHMPAPPDANDLLGRLLGDFTRQDLQDYIDRLEELTEAEQMLLQYHVWNRYSSIMREDGKFSGLPKIDKVRERLIGMLETQRSIDRLEKEINELKQNKQEKDADENNESI